MPRRRLDARALSHRLGLPFLFFCLVTWALAGWAGSRRAGPDLAAFAARAWPGATARPEGGGVLSAHRGGALLGYVATGSAPGYSGPVTLAVAASADGRLRGLALVEYRDTPELLPRVRALLAPLLGRSAAAPLRPGSDYQAVTGATASSAALARAVEEAGREIAARLPDAAAEGRGPRFGAPEVALLALAAVAAAAQNRRRIGARARRRLRAAVLAASLALLGLLFAAPWTIAFPLRLATGVLPPLAANLYWYLLLAVVLLTFSRAGRSPYCPWLCPFGAAQDLLGSATGALRRRPPAALLFLWVKRLLLWLAVLLGLLHRAPGAASYEPFATLFRLEGSGFQIAALAVVLALALAVRRPFCAWLCPVDAIEQPLRRLRRALGRLAGRPAPARRDRRPLLPVLAAPPAPAPATLARLRARLLVAAGLLGALLLLAHLGARLAHLSRGEQEGLAARTFVRLDA
ncbi:MAG: 4Fe-4S binding protein [Thermoanaerobaculia bacterium]|nr:4Fe-4S binding protein [Thermoanaerobaculia bacterium]